MGQTIQERLDIKQEFMDCKGRATDIIERAKGRSRDPIDRNRPILPGTSHSELVYNDIAVTKMQLPTFSGAYEYWPGFADQFPCTIHENTRLDDCTRLMYLRSCLMQVAADSVVSLAKTASNYSVAWELMETRYKKILVNVSFRESKPNEREKTLFQLSA